MSRVGNFAFLLIVVFGLSGCETNWYSDFKQKDKAVTKEDIIKQISTLRKIVNANPARSKRYADPTLIGRLDAAAEALEDYTSSLTVAKNEGIKARIAKKYLDAKQAEVDDHMNDMKVASTGGLEALIDKNEAGFVKTDDENARKTDNERAKEKRESLEEKIFEDTVSFTGFQDAQTKGQAFQKSSTEASTAANTYFLKALKAVNYVQNTVDGWNEDQGSDESSGSSGSSDDDEADDDEE